MGRKDEGCLDNGLLARPYPLKKFDVYDVSKATPEFPRRAVIIAADECLCSRELVWASRPEFMITGCLY